MPLLTLLVSGEDATALLSSVTYVVSVPLEIIRDCIQLRCAKGNAGHWHLV